MYRNLVWRQVLKGSLDRRRNCFSLLSNVITVLAIVVYAVVLRSMRNLCFAPLPLAAAQALIEEREGTLIMIHGVEHFYAGPN